MKYFVSISLVFLLFNNALQAQVDYQKAVDAFEQSAFFGPASVGVSLVDVATGKELAGTNSGQSLTPASSLKVITTGAALAILGTDYRFKTELQYDGTIDEQGTLKGNLYIKGYGDPTLGSDHFGGIPDLANILDIFATAIRKAGIKKIDGHIVGDASYFDTMVAGRGWSWEDLGNYYGVGAWGLNIHDNRFYLDFQQTQQLGGTPKIVKTKPEIPGLLLINEIKSDKVGTGDNAYLFAAPHSYTAFVRGTIPVGSQRFTIKGALPDPPFACAHWLMERLGQQGISTTGLATTDLELSRKGSTKEKRKTIFTHQSPDLAEIVTVTNIKSVNLYCEALLRVLGQVKKGQGTAVAGLEVVTEFYESRGFDTKGFFMEDGSGLSPRNAITARQMAEVMRILYKEKSIKVDFYDSLPAAGKTGSLKKLLRGTIAVNRLSAKSGALQRVRSYTGYAEDQNGRLKTFSIIVNNYIGESYPVKRAMKKLMIEFCK